MKSILVIFAVLGMAAQTHAQTSCSSAPWPCPPDFDEDPDYDYIEGSEASFKANCCYSDCAAVQNGNGYVCNAGTANSGEGALASYGVVSDQQGFQNTCCVDSCETHGESICAVGQTLKSDAATIAPNINPYEECCEDTPLTCAQLQDTYNDPNNGVEENLECTGTVTDMLLELPVPAYTTTADTENKYTYNDFTNGGLSTHEQVQDSFNSACCVCDVGATKEVEVPGGSENIPCLIYEIPGDYPECLSITIEQLKGIKQATDAAGDALTSTCALAET